jgi:hypothetical protein
MLVHAIPRQAHNISDNLGDMAMAIVHVGSIKVTDHNQKSKTENYYFDAGMTAIDVEVALGNIAEKLDDTIDGVVTEISATLFFALPAGLKTVAGENTINEGASASFNIVDSNNHDNKYFQSMKDTYFVGGKLNTAHADVIALAAAITGTLTSEGSELGSLFRGKYSVRK